MEISDLLGAIKESLITRGIKCIDHLDSVSICLNQSDTTLRDVHKEKHLTISISGATVLLVHNTRIEGSSSYYEWHHRLDLDNPRLIDLIEAEFWAVSKSIRNRLTTWEP